MIHYLLPRVWRLAVGEWEIPRGVADTDDYHNMANSKVYRAKRVAQA